jgi:hypothetical protein
MMAFDSPIPAEALFATAHPFEEFVQDGIVLSREPKSIQPEAFRSARQSAVAPAAKLMNALQVPTAKRVASPILKPLLPKKLGNAKTSKAP